MAYNRVIGCNNQIPWHLPEELNWFRQTTLHQSILMGRKTFESLGCKALPKRTNYVLTHQSLAVTDNVIVIHDLSALEGINDTVWVCGGASIYKALLPKCSELLLTVVKQTIQGDAFFPDIPSSFTMCEVIKDTIDFTIQRWINNQVDTCLQSK